MLIRPYGVVGVGTWQHSSSIRLEKLFLIWYVWKKMKIPPGEYIPIVSWLIHSAILILIFVLIDHRIIDLH